MLLVCASIAQRDSVGAAKHRGNSLPFAGLKPAYESRFLDTVSRSVVKKMYG